MYTTVQKYVTQILGCGFRGNFFSWFRCNLRYNSCTQYKSLNINADYSAMCMFVFGENLISVHDS